ncbi:hypothetical protein EUTSA_v10026950mg [Eutrema salsugineum]|uniref:Phytocyanin domain-containing protein n=1 Tax=Eutrema salsugineum TaxID=72664 RepID=V4P2Z7_EUTSA|nr:homeobox protein 5 [Eutrema salsugineum]ESQ53751.1 hypothetical protein EUTSA_v10026950mg [Eutrema salsugineum]
MALSQTRKLLLALVTTAYVFSGTAQAWSWSWSSDESGSNWSWGWGSDNSGGGSSSGGSDSNSGDNGSSWGWGWSSDGTDTHWSWGSSSGSNHSSGTGSTHNSHHNQTVPSNHSSGTGSTHNNHTAPSNHSGGTGSTSNNSHHNHTAAPISHRRKIEVTVWKSGFDYQEWASKHAPFYVNDVLVVKYNNNNNDRTKSKTKHSNKNDVYLLPDSRSYKRCDVNRGKKLVARGSSKSSLGFKLLLRKTQTYYLASGDHNGCNHNMKFSVSPVPRPSSHTKP